MRLISSALLLILLAVSPSRAQDSGVVINADFRRSMVFNPQTSDDGTMVIFAVGVIESDTHRSLEALLARAKAPAGTIVAFHSPGGNAYDGMEIGRIIRKHQFITTVGQFRPNHTLKEGISQPALCASACTLAFLGGTVRTVPENSRYGVHDVYLANGQNISGQLALGQEVAADMGQYMFDMGVNPGLLTILTRFDSSAGQIYWVPPALRQELGVVTPVVQTKWSPQFEYGGTSGWSIVGSVPASATRPNATNSIVFSCDTVGQTRTVVNLAMLPFNDFVDERFLLDNIDRVEITSLSPSNRTRATDVWLKDSNHPTRFVSLGDWIGIAFDARQNLVGLLKDTDQFAIKFWFKDISQARTNSRKERAEYESFSVDFAPERQDVLKLIEGCK